MQQIRRAINESRLEEYLSKKCYKIFDSRKNNQAKAGNRKKYSSMLARFLKEMSKGVILCLEGIYEYHECQRQGGLSWQYDYETDYKLINVSLSRDKTKIRMYFQITYNNLFVKIEEKYDLNIINSTWNLSEKPKHFLVNPHDCWECPLTNQSKSN